MPTENRRIATYLPKEVDEKFKTFKLERGLKGDSLALIAILEEFFGLTDPVAPLMSTQYEELSRQLDDLRTKLSSLEGELFSRLKGELLAECSNVPASLVSDSLSQLVHAPVRSSDFKSGDISCMTGKELSLRLGLRADTANRWRPGKDRAKSPDSLLEATRKKDPDGIGWLYLPETDKFQSEKPLPVKLPSSLLSELPALPLFDRDCQDF